MEIPYDIFDTLPRECWANIDTRQLTENVRILCKTVNTPVLVAVKANGYGHGYANAARAFVAGGASYLAVVTVSEGVLLRRMGLTCPILIIGGLLPHEMKYAAEENLDFFVWRADHIAAVKLLPSAKVHIKVDTGMGRGGCMPEEVLGVATALKQIKTVDLVGVCTHLASADVMGVPDTDKQLDKFDAVVAALTAANLRPRIVHAANSPGALYFPRGRFDMVRFGIAGYGIPPDEGLQIPAGIKPALSWRARITSTKVLPTGHGVGYGSEYKVKGEMRIGVVPVGYADGYRRTPKGVNSVIVDGQERKVLGRVCMDQCMIDLSGLGDITGVEVELLGTTITAETLAKRWNTNPYDVCTGIAARVPRRVVS